MIKGEFNFDIKEARFNDGDIYANAYSISNEPLVDIIKLLPVQDKRVLTVAASGDQPILYAAAGASHVDTFDMTYVARVIMDFKTTAIKVLNRTEYFDQINNIDNLDIQYKKEPFHRTVAQMPATTGPIMQMFVSQCRFNAFHRPDNGSSKNLYEICTNWPQMHKNIRAPFDFIWTNLINLHNYIDGQYDIINISNILEHYRNEGDILKTFQNLWPHLRTGGHIVCSAFSICDETVPKESLSWLNRRAQINYYYRNRDLCDTILIQKQR